jgi:hypothetical protein
MIAAANGARQVRERANSRYFSGDTTNRIQRHIPGTGAVNTRNAVKTATVLPVIGASSILLNGAKAN